MSTRKTFYQDTWENHPDLKDWIRPVPGDPKLAYCSYCSVKIFLSNMGRQALFSHMNGKKHTERLKRSSSQLEVFFQPKKSSIMSPSLSEPHASVSSSSESASVPVVLSTNRPRGLEEFVLKDDVTTAEILWCVETVMTHKSLREAEKDVAVISRMFKDSAVAKKMQLKRDKIGYVLLFGIAPYFYQQLLGLLMKATYIVLGFDESLNKVVGRTQMDVNVRFWDEEKEEVITRYLTSSFLGRSRATDLLSSFIEVTKGIPKSKILQISMDGPNVNWLFLKEYKAHSAELKLLELGSCGLHCMHNAFKDAIKATHWDISLFLRALYNLFKNVPARRALYTQYSGSTMFPKKFCCIRWLENSAVAQRAIDIAPNIQKFIDGVKKDKIEPKCESFMLVCKFMKDPLLCPKLAFFKSLACDVEAFQTEFQADAPLTPFLHTALVSTIKTVLEHFVKPEILEKTTSIKLADIKEEKNLLPAKNIILGFDTRKELRKISSDIKTADILKFRQDCKKSLQTFVMKLNNRSPLNYPLTQAITCLDPGLVVSNISLTKSRLDKLLCILTESGHVSGSAADNAMRDFKEVTSLPHVINSFKDYNRSVKRIDHFWRDILGDKYQNLMAIVKLVCCLSHGNANIERGFSVNGECLFENMAEKSVVARRQIYDAVSHIGGIDSLEISKSLIHSARNAHSRFIDYRNQLKEQNRAEEQSLLEKRKRDMELKVLEAKRLKILETATKEALALEEQMKALKH